MDCEGGEDTASAMLESKAINLLPSFKKRNLLASSQFMYYTLVETPLGDSHKNFKSPIFNHHIVMV